MRWTKTSGGLSVFCWSQLGQAFSPPNNQNKYKRLDATVLHVADVGIRAERQQHQLGLPACPTRVWTTRPTSHSTSSPSSPPSTSTTTRLLRWIHGELSLLCSYPVFPHWWAGHWWSLCLTPLSTLPPPSCPPPSCSPAVNTTWRAAAAAAGDKSGAGSDNSQQSTLKIKSKTTD